MSGLTLLLWLGLAVAAEVDDGYSQLASGQKDTARELFLKARRDEVQAPMANRGLALLAAGGDAKAESALASSKKDPAARAGQGWLALTRALDQSPPDAALLDEARMAFAEATVADADMALAWYGLAEVYVSLGDDPSAVRPLATARRLDPAMPLAVQAEKKLRSRYLAVIVAAASAGSLAGPPMMPLDPALHDDLQRWIDDAVRRSAAEDAEKALVEFGRLATWLKSQGDLCGPALLQVAAGRVGLRLDLRPDLVSALDVGLNEVSACADAPKRKAQAQLARAELNLIRGEPLSAAELATSARTGAAAARYAGLEADATLLLVRALLASDKVKEAEAIFKALPPQTGGDRRDGHARLVRSALGRATGAPTPGAATADLFEKLGDDLGLAEALIEDAASQISVGDAGKALPLLQNASHIGRDTGSIVLLADVARLTGDAYLALKEWSRAFDQYQATLKELGGHNLPAREATALLSMGEAAFLIPDFARAADSISRARQVFDSWGKTGSGERARGAVRGNAQAILLLARAKLANGEVTEGLKLLGDAREKAESIRDNVARDAALALIAMADPDLELLRAAGVTLSPPPGADELVKLLPVYGVAPPAPAQAAATYISLGQQLLARGEIERAIDFLRIGFERLPPADRIARAGALVSYAEANALAGRYSAAASALEAALGYESEPKAHARVAALLGRIRAWEGHERAVPLLQAALAEAVAAGDAPARGRAQIELGRLLLPTDPAAAAAAFDDAVAAFSTVESGRIEAAAWLVLVKPEGALAAAASLVNGADALGDPGLQLFTRLVWLRAAPPPADTGPLVLLPALLDSLRHRRAPIVVLGLGPSDDRMELRGLYAWYPELILAAERLHAAGASDEAFRLLVNLDGGETADWAEFHTRRTAQGNARKDPHPSDLIRVVMDDAFLRVEALDFPKVPPSVWPMLQRRVAAAHAALAASYPPLLVEGQKQVTARTLAEVQRRLKALDGRGEPHRLISFYVTSTRMLRLVVSAEGVKLVGSDHADVPGLAARVVAGLGPGAASGTDADRLLYADLSALYTVLFGPVAGELPEGARLLVVPGRQLAAVPFDALITEAPPATPSLASAPFLVERHALSLLPTSDWLARPRDPVEGEVSRPPKIGVFEGAKSGAEPELIRAAVAKGGVVSRCGPSDTTACKKGNGIAGFQEMARAELDVIHLALPAANGGLALSAEHHLRNEQLRHTMLYTDLVVLPSGASQIGPALADTRVRSSVSGAVLAHEGADRRWLSSFYQAYAVGVAADPFDAGWKVDAAREASLSLLLPGDAGARPYAHPMYWSGRLVWGAPN